MTAALKAPGVTLSATELIALRQVALRPLDEPVLAALPGGFAIRRKGHGQEVADVREYVAGDDIRHLDKGTTARTGALHVRQFHEERDRVSLLVADFRPSMLWGISRAFRSVAAAEALCLIGWRIVVEGGRVGLLAMLPDGQVVVAPRGRARGMLDVIGGLARAHDMALQSVIDGHSEDRTLDEALSRTERLVSAGAEVLIASGFDHMGEGLADRLSSLARRRVPRLIRVVDGATDNLPAGRYPIRLPDGRRIRVAMHDKSATPPEMETIAGRPALLVNAGAEIVETARRLATSLPSDRTP
ncbi:DUF58 domain-containing protein [Primorskyibacter flagellatus]|uniref:DUF58 domain-containing protein n=1 Tax=Primorskyibacter flagellatus TaxID=1387277 RepID=A0A1W2A4H6_9RHOB|nr:DUF58 domain-containing protein [Primorskyibacter flagellatus]SMC55575.1 Protein of unknown function DUF58 [Primorskyibacter flagellatus]